MTSEISVETTNTDVQDDVQDDVGDVQDTVLIFDTTLRDGEQSPGATLHLAEKLDIARQLSRLGVDIIEAGFPAASPGDLEAVRRIAETVGNDLDERPQGRPPVIAGLARANKDDIDKAWEAVQAAAYPRIHTFIATSDIHIKHKLRMTREQVLERTREMVAYAKQYCDDIEFSPEDAGRSDPEFLYQVLAVAIEAGATTLNIPDTVGYTTPEEFGALIRGIRENVPGIENVIISVHCHDDLGLAVANSLAGVQAGARQVECTVNGIGERAGNAALEEIVMALYVRRPYYKLRTNIVTTEIHRTSDMVSRYTGILVQPNKAIVGANAFAHEAGIHQDGILKHRRTYEIMDASTIGLSESRLVLGKHSGRHAFRAKLEAMGYHLSDEELNQVFRQFKELADKKKVVTDADLEAIVADRLYQPPETYSLEAVQVQCGRPSIPTAVVRLKRLSDGAVFTEAGFGTGPVDAVYQGINRIVGVPNKLVEFSIQAITEGLDAVGDVTIRIEATEPVGEQESATGGRGRRVFTGRGVDTDIVVASAKAYMQALNKLLAAKQGIEPTISVAANPAAKGADGEGAS
ncbi:MAG TPA: 2-isopropylmalate synthase [Caldilineae bacterium]|nr:2-isopropylmalate synthase [Caldilineae bacterium]